MELPRIPTDNLYKFIAIFGLFLFLVSVTLPIYWLTTMTPQYIELLTNQQKMMIDNTAVYHDIDDLRFDIESKEPGNRGELIKRFGEKSNKATQIEIELMRNEQIIADLKANIDLSRFYFRSGFVFSICLMAFGFFTWYMKLQKHQDIMIAKQAENYMKNNIEIISPPKSEAQKKSIDDEM